MDTPQTTSEMVVDLQVSIVELDEMIAARKANAQPTACHRCLYHSSNSLLACAVHPLERSGEVCGDWEEAEPKAFSSDNTTLHLAALAAAPALGCSVGVAAVALRFAEVEYRQTLEVLHHRIMAGNLMLEGDRLLEVRSPVPDWESSALRAMLDEATNSAEDGVAAEQDRLLNPDGRFCAEAVQISIDTPLTVEEAEYLIGVYGLETAQRVAGAVACGRTIDYALRAIALEPDYPATPTSSAYEAP